jgi:hypothetical protein
MAVGSLRFLFLPPVANAAATAAPWPALVSLFCFSVFVLYFNIYFKCETALFYIG